MDQRSSSPRAFLSRYAPRERNVLGDDEPMLDRTLRSTCDVAADLNDALAGIVRDGGIVDEVHYAIDPSTEANRRGGFGAVVLYETAVEG